MRDARSVFSLRSVTQPVFLLLALFSLISSGTPVLAQTQSIVGTNAFAFAKTADTIMEGEGSYRVVVTRATGMRGKITVDVAVKDDPRKAVDPAFTGTTLTFDDYQLSASFMLPIADVANVQTNASVITLELKNPKLIAGQNAAFTPGIVTAGAESKISVMDDDKAVAVSLQKANFSGNEGGDIEFTVKLGAAPASAAELANVSVRYTVRLATAAELGVGADRAQLTDLTDDFRTNNITGVLTFNDQGMATLRVPTTNDNLVEFDEELIVELSEPAGDLPNPASTNTPPDRIPVELNAFHKMARLRILFQDAPAGAVDQAFNPDNVPPLQLRRPGANGPVTAIAVDRVTTNYFVAGNFTAVNAISRHGLARLTHRGTVDPAFTPAPNINGPVTSIDFYPNAQHEGKVIVGGGFSAVSGQPRNSVARYLSNGDLDPNFAIGLGANGPVYAVKVEGDNSAIIAGAFTTFDGQPRGRIARLLPNGRLDPNTFNGPGANGTIFDLALQIPEPFRFSESRTNSTNIVTTSRDVPARSGIVELTYNNFEFTNDWVVRFGNTIVYSGRLTNDFEVVVNTNDQTTITNYTAETIPINLPLQAQAGAELSIQVTPFPYAETNAVAWSFTAVVTPLGTESIAAVGDFTSFNQVPVNRVVKLDDAGNVDPGFASNIGTGANGPALAVDFQRNGSLIVGGTFTAFNSREAGSIVRLSPSGAPDQLFASGTGANGAIRDIFVEKPDAHPQFDTPNRVDRVYIAGDFTEYNGSRRIFVARLMPQGYLDTSFMDSAYNQFAGFPSSSGFAPDGTIAAIAVARNPGPVVGGIFDVVGGGATRDSTKPRQNFARLVGGQTGGPGNLSMDDRIFGADEDGETLRVNFTIANASTTPPGIGPVGPIVRIVTEDLSATSGVDYEPLDVVSREADPDQNITIIDDEVIEGDEEFLIELPELIGFLNLSGEPIYPELAYGLIRTGTGRIVENDVEPAVFSFSNLQYNVDENRTTASVEIFRSGSAGDRVTVQFSALISTNSNAAGLGDFTTVENQIVTFPSGVTNITVSVPIRDDQVVEVDETVALVLGAPSAGAIVSTNAGAATLNIIDNDLPSGKIDFSLSGFTVVEGEPNAVVTLVRTGGNVGFIRVSYETRNGSALAGSDYETRSGTLTWNDRDISTRTILIPIANDSLVEAPETFTVGLILTNASAPGVIGTRNPTTTVTINDNDFFGDLSFSANEYFTDENGNGAVIQVVRRNGSAGTVSVTYSTSPGPTAATAAVPNKDYNNVTNTLTFEAGETAKTFIVPIIDDTDTDGTRQFVVRLTAPVNGRLGEFSTAIVNIVDNETENVPAGGVDTDFISGGGANSAINVVAIHTEPNATDRRILIAGDFTLFDFLSRERIARLNNDGSLDRNFGVNTTINGAIRTMLVLPDGKIMIGGHFTAVDGATTKYLTRLNTVGRLDTSFQAGAGPDNTVYALAQTFAGNPTNGPARILVGGEFVTFDSQPSPRLAMIRPDGGLDPNFDVGFGPNGPVYAIAVQRDQKIIIGGDFDTFDGVPRPHIARLNPDGSLDLTFNPADGFDGTVRSIAIQADDRILVGGDFTVYGAAATPRARIARLNLDGSLDISFNPGTGADAVVSSIVLQPDGKILLGGDFVTFNQQLRRGIVRLLSSGAIDYSINFGAGPNGAVNSVALQSDRGILIAGDFTEVDGHPRNRVARLFGGTFAGTGALEFADPVYLVNESGSAVTILVRRTGGLEGTISATYNTIDFTAVGGEDYTTSTGQLTFQSGEMFRTITIPLLDDFLLEDEEAFGVELVNPVNTVIGRQPVTTVQISSDDSEISFDNPVYLVQENAPGGRVNINVVRRGVSAEPITVRFTTTDDTAMAGSDYTAVSTLLTFQAGETNKVVSVPLRDDLVVEGDEQVDLRLQLITQGSGLSLGTSTATLTIADNDTAPGSLQFASDVSVDEDAGSVIVIVTRAAGKLGTVSVKYATQPITASAPEDFTSQTGTLTFQQTDTAKPIVIQISDDELVEGNETFRVVLFDPTNGAVLGVPDNAVVTIVDTDFGPGSLDQTFSIGEGVGSGQVYDIALQEDGKIVVGGEFFEFNNTGNQHLVRLDANGSVDSGFSTGSGPSDTVHAVGVDPLGRIVIGGEFRSVNGIDRPYIARLTPTGAPDPTQLVSPGLNDSVLTLAVQPDSKAVLGGIFSTPAQRAGRMLINGSFDVSFNVSSGANGPVYSSRVQTDGKVLLGGAFTQFGGLPRGGVVRLLDNGLVDPAFNTSVGASGGTVWHVRPVAEGKVLVAGDFLGFNGVPVGGIVRLNSDGSIDTTFNADIDGVIYATGVQADGKIVIGGDFTQVDGADRNNIARLNADGSLDTDFNAGLGPNGPIFDIEIQSDQKILIAGNFTEVNGFPRAGVARLNWTEPAQEIQITSTLLSGSDLQLTFQSQSGVNYEIEATSDVANPASWTVVRNVTANGPTTQVAFPTTANYQFFRVKRTSP